MSVKARRIVAALSGGAWFGWVVMYTLSKLHDVGVLHVVMMEIIRSAAMMVTISLILGWVVGPLVATARIWYRIGTEEQQKKCSCSASRQRAAQLSNIIPITFNDTLSRGGAVRTRDN